MREVDARHLPSRLWNPIVNRTYAVLLLPLNSPSIKASKTAVAARPFTVTRRLSIRIASTR